MAKFLLDICIWCHPGPHGGTLKSSGKVVIMISKLSERVLVKIFKIIGQKLVINVQNLNLVLIKIEHCFSNAPPTLEQNGLRLSWVLYNDPCSSSFYHLDIFPAHKALVQPIARDIDHYNKFFNVKIVFLEWYFLY